MVAQARQLYILPDKLCSQAWQIVCLQSGSRRCFQQASNFSILAIEHPHSRSTWREIYS